jgi:hypothetical protein
MPRYHFHIIDGVDLRDYRGTELSDEDEARRYAEDMAQTVARWPSDKSRRIKVTDDTGREVLALPVSKD